MGETIATVEYRNAHQYYLHALWALPLVSV